MNHQIQFLVLKMYVSKDAQVGTFQLDVYMYQVGFHGDAMTTGIESVLRRAVSYRGKLRRITFWKRLKRELLSIMFLYANLLTHASLRARKLAHGWLPE